MARMKLTEDSVKGMICTCEVCGSKFIDPTGIKSLMCPRCIEETVSRHKNELAEKSVTSPNSILGNMPVTPFNRPVKVPKKGTPEHDDSPCHTLDAQLYALDMGFTKNDNGKLQWSLMPFVELEEVVRVLMNGAKTYSPDNWKKCDDVNRYKDALMRHVVSYITGETYDKGKGGDGLHHLAHAVCDCLFLMWFDNQKEK